MPRTYPGNSSATYVLAGEDFDLPAGIAAVAGVPVGYKVSDNRVQFFGGIVIAETTDLDGLAIIPIPADLFPAGNPGGSGGPEWAVYTTQGVVDAYLYNGGTDHPEWTGLWLQNVVIDGTERVARTGGDMTAWLDVCGYERVP